MSSKGAGPGGKVDIRVMVMDDDTAISDVSQAVDHVRATLKQLLEVGDIGQRRKFTNKALSAVCFALEELDTRLRKLEERGT